MQRREETLHITTPQWSACRILHCTILHCTILHCTILHLDVLHRTRSLSPLHDGGGDGVEIVHVAVAAGRLLALCIHIDQHVPVPFILTSLFAVG